MLIFIGTIFSLNWLFKYTVRETIMLEWTTNFFFQSLDFIFDEIIRR